MDGDLRELPAWSALGRHHEDLRDTHLRTLFAEDPGRAERLVFEGAGLRLDLSKHRITDETLRLLVALARDRGLPERIEAMFSGEHVNPTEDRPALHTALRAPRSERLVVDGVDVVGVDLDRSMLETARAGGADIEWYEHDLATLELGRVFDVVVMAGNVPLFTPAGTQRAVVAGCARHVGPRGALIAGFQLGRGYELDAYDDDCRGAGLVLAERYATWDREPFGDGANYAVSIHRRSGM
jgi:hypothetical protein